MGERAGGGDHSTCVVEAFGRRCESDVSEGAPLPLCDAHLLVAHDWVARATGSTDLLPSPCRLCGSRLGVRYPSGWACGVCEWRAGAVPDDELPPPRVDVVYYVRFDDRVKIGTSSNPRARIAALPHHEVLAFELGGRVLERARHARFAAHRIPGTEWFERSPELDEHVAALREGAPDPWERHAFWMSRAYALQRSE
ncbi:GIY-YIG nuclease family protein [Agromyces protaetiae]|uniref:GIY-YIG nuclease family protein n=1 Tax=Agromyces protaetiae TaxID=2509455 RepID=A0A4P6FDQ3_9MICO|nr:GIY-YIG nuclease family protein [Agromyces protaetiae]QAY74054.1 GIY-YIG nuclease family protein [Agromyces protaetiae]